MVTLHMDRFKRVSNSHWGIHYSLRELRVLFTLTTALHNPVFCRSRTLHHLAGLDVNLCSWDSANTVTLLDNRRWLGHVPTEDRLVDEVGH